jgi:uncharacterized membrane protein
MYRLQTEPSVAAPVADVLPTLAARLSGAARPRLDGIDFLRGLVMIIMVLDHARDFFSGSGASPRDVHDTALFLTRWVTHFCAPVFIFLAGISAHLYGQRGRTTGELSRFLLSRGLWLVLIELTVVRFAWTFSPAYDYVFVQVIWAIGCSLIALAGLVFLPRWAIATIALAMIAGHNLLDAIQPADLGAAGTLWMFVHATGSLQPVPGVEMLVFYPLVPWIGVMAAGYLLAPVMLREESQRGRTLVTLGIAVTIGFIVLRATNLYGDPAPWAVQDTAMATVLSFINCEKYAPSLLYLAMTLGPALIVLGSFRAARGALGRAIVTIGRVPFLFYVAHLVLLHLLAVIVSWAMTGDVAWLFQRMPVMAKPEGYGFALPPVYGVWIMAVLMLYPLARAFAAIKQRRTDWWLSYL